ncbi:MAG: NAD-dependent epimerase/dehydratase family protein [Alphaproteobacteria bacterium]|nr:NAD-dependent epimerase/dehydratase family protein [Alphaproteobacteria bacterium]
MHVFMTGVTGYIGGAVALKLLAAGHTVTGLARTAEKGDGLTRLGVIPVLGTLDDIETIGDAAGAAEAVINLASTNHPVSARTIVAALAGSGKPYIHTSGSSIVADNAGGERNDNVYSEDTPFMPLADRAGWFAVERQIVLPAAQQGVRSVVLTPCMIYGDGPGLNRDSLQVPLMIRTARQWGVAGHVGAGRNIWSNVHLSDCADAYLLALERAPAGSLFYIEAGEAALGDIAAAINRKLGFGNATKSLSLPEAMRAWGPNMALSLGSNSRIRADKARAMLGWTPKGPSLFDVLAS